MVLPVCTRVTACSTLVSTCAACTDCSKRALFTHIWYSVAAGTQLQLECSCSWYAAATLFSSLGKLLSHEPNFVPAVDQLHRSIVADPEHVVHVHRLPRRLQDALQRLSLLQPVGVRVEVAGHNPGVHIHGRSGLDDDVVG